MKVATLALIVLLVIAGCATQRPYTTSSPPAGGSGPTLIPDTTPHLGDPVPRGGPSSYNRGSGPKLKMPEARRDASPASPPRVASGWQPTPGTSQTTRFRPAASPVSSFEPPTVLADGDWSRVHRSTDRRPIETVRLGAGPRRIAILGSLHGDETQSVALVEELARHLRQHPEALGSTTVLLVKTPNPDGCAVRSPYNVHGVDLNRNFPSANWKALPNQRAGARAASEAETKALVKMLDEFRPNLLVHLKDSRNEAAVNGEGADEGAAERVARTVNGKALHGLGARTSGSVENYAATLLDCPSVTLLSALESSDRAAWAANREALLSLLGGTSSAAGGAGTSDGRVHPFDRATLRNSSLSNQRPSVSPFENPADVVGTRPSTSKTKPAVFPSAIPERGYFELPAP